MHAPFIYYIAKENFMIAADEYYNNSLNLMINRIKKQDGDPRYYLAELRALKRNKQSTIDLIG